MLREKTIQEIQNFCQSKNIKCLNIRSFNQKGKARVKITCCCKECGQRYDILKDTLFKQEFPGLCSSCAHKKSWNSKRLTAQYIIDFFEKNGYKVLTPVEKIKPVGKTKSYNKAVVKVEDKHGYIFDICYNNFYNRLNHYKEINELEPSNDLKGRESRLEYKVRIYLEELNIPYKQQFRYKDCRGKKYPMPFDFCLWYDVPSKRKLIEVDGEQHFRKEFVDIQKHDKIKNYYCQQHNIPLLRISYHDFNQNNTYKKKIDDYINN